jgi:hypothetical protein
MRSEFIRTPFEEVIESALWIQYVEGKRSPMGLLQPLRSESP